MNFAKEQHAQQLHHERVNRLEGGEQRHTLHPKQGYNKQQRREKKPHIPKGHDATLKSAQDLGEVIVVQPINGDSYTCTLLNRDRYTISVQLEDGKKRIVYKHAIEYIDLPEGVEVVRHAINSSH